MRKPSSDALFSLVVGAIMLAGCATTRPLPQPASGMMIASDAFTDRGEIPDKHTCEGQDVSPSLRWSGVPAEAKSLALIVDDPDAPDPAAPKQTWVHWVVYDLAPNVHEIEEGSAPAGSVQGVNDWQKNAYGGPCPPIGRHRYFFKLYALDVPIGKRGLSKAELEEAMKGHVIAEARIVGTYEKKAGGQQGP